MADQKLDRYSLLLRMHARVEQSVFDPETPPRDLAALTRRLMEIAKEIETIELQREQSGEGKPEAPADEPFDGSDV
ncbi:terminase small subunit [Mycobacterium phage Shandong1]|uniref:Terminase small subunit n=1 Tax=Mycobacterium phage Shandong1 TaxID=1983447 RepID=A0A1X9SH36_9CAUD|nr:terminase small subunit [Mycobacterium phage Shandong1]ARQ95443.1 terminase small subunit [Mycobacterium phage Shandong1]